MHRHRTDFLALFFGLAFLATGTGFIVHQTTGRAFDASWIAAVALVSIGCIFLGATLLRGPRPSASSSPAPSVAGPYMADAHDPASTEATPASPAATPASPAAAAERTSEDGD
jgi:hypothetical protein